MKKLSPSVKLRKEVSEFIERLQDVDSAEDVLTQLVQLSTQLIRKTLTPRVGTGRSHAV